MGNKMKRVAFGGIMVALAVATVFAVSLVPTGKISIYVLASFLTFITILHYGVKGGVLLYVTASLLAWILVPNKLAVIPYIGFVGWYGIIKYAIEKFRKPSLEWILKLIVMSVVFLTALLLYPVILPTVAYVKPITWGYFLLFLVAYVLYDCIFTKVMSIYIRRYYKRFNGPS